jgi:transcriptional/translational regulatory protein YebC/TACO1
VAFQFKHCGQLILAPGTSEDAVMEAALDAGADDVLVDEDGAVEVLTSPTAFESVKAALDAVGLLAGMAEITYRPEVTIELSDDDRLKMQKIIDALEELDDVQEVFHNAAL